MRASARKTLKVAAIVVAIYIAIIVVLPWCLGFAVEGLVKTAGSAILGVPVSVERVSLSAITGKAVIRGFEIGNPEGFDTPYLLHSDKLLVDVHMRDLIGGTCHIEDIQVIGPKVWYHSKITKSNLSTLLDNLGGDADDADKKKKEDVKPDEKGEGMPVIIDHFIFDEGTVGVKMGAGVEIPLAKIELNDIGKDGAFMPVQIVRVIFSAIFDSVIHVVTAVGGAAVDAATAVGGAAVDAAGSLIKGVGSLFSDGQKTE